MSLRASLHAQQSSNSAVLFPVFIWIVNTYNPKSTHILSHPIVKFRTALLREPAVYKYMELALGSSPYLPQPADGSASMRSTDTGSGVLLVSLDERL